VILTAAGCAGRPASEAPSRPAPPAEAESAPAAHSPAAQSPAGASAPEITAGHSETELLLDLTGRVMQARSAEEQRSIESAWREAVATDPSADNQLRLTLVRALTAALPTELEAVRQDLLELIDARAELTDNQRHFAELALLLVDERLSLGMQIADLQRQIESLTEIEASLNTGAGSTERTP
jgi:hypothetical protein